MAHECKIYPGSASLCGLGLGNVHVPIFSGNFCSFLFQDSGERVLKKHARASYGAAAGVVQADNRGIHVGAAFEASRRGGQCDE